MANTHFTSSYAFVSRLRTDGRLSFSLYLALARDLRNREFYAIRHAKFVSLSTGPADRIIL